MGRKKLSEQDLWLLRYRFDNGGGSVRELSKLFGISKSQVHRILRNKQRKKEVRRSEDEC